IPGVPYLVLNTHGEPLLESGSSTGDPFANPVLNCASGESGNVHASSSSHGGPGGGSYLRLSSSEGIACISSTIPWSSGPIRISLNSRHIEGAAPQICVFEESSNRCAIAPTLPTSSTWTPYVATIFPDPGTTGLTI